MGAGEGEAQESKAASPLLSPPLSVPIKILSWLPGPAQPAASSTGTQYIAVRSEQDAAEEDEDDDSDEDDGRHNDYEMQKMPIDTDSGNAGDTGSSFSSTPSCCCLCCLLSLLLFCLVAIAVLAAALVRHNPAGLRSLACDWDIFSVVDCTGLPPSSSSLPSIRTSYLPPLAPGSSLLPAFSSDAFNMTELNAQCARLCRWQWDGSGDADNREQVYAAYHDAGYDELVCPSNLRNLAEFVIEWPFDHFHESQLVTRPHYDAVARCLLPGAIVYSQTNWCTDEVGFRSQTADPPCGDDQTCVRLFHAAHSHLRSPIILLTGQSDYPAHGYCPYLLDRGYNVTHPLLLHWFAQNADLPPHPSFSPLPIGINCWEHAAAVREAVMRQYGMARAQQCFGEGKEEERLKMVEQSMPAMRDWMRALDIQKRRSRGRDRVGVLETLLHLSYFSPSPALLRLHQTVNSAYFRMDSKDDLSVIAAVMKQRRAENISLPPASTPVMPCSLLSSTLTPISSPLPAPLPVPANVRNARAAVAAGHGKLAVANFGPSHPRRAVVKAALCAPSTANNSHWLSCQEHSWAGLNLAALYSQLSQYLFWLSPRGNGLESHRTWEALYLGCVPVLERSEITDGLFADGDLPVLLVDDLTTLSMRTLAANVERFSRLQQDFSRRKLTMRHWKQLILSRQRHYRGGLKQEERRQTGSVGLQWDRERRRCWGSSNHSYSSDAD